jgi:hypothetical protein
MKRISIILSSAGALLVTFALWIAIAPQPSQAATYPPRSGDPCSINMRVTVPINLIASGQVVTGATNKQTFICHISINTAAAQSIALVEGTGAICGTNTAGMAGGNTAALGWNLSVNQTLSEGVGSWQINSTATAGDSVCLLLSGVGQTSGVIQYVQQ